MRSLLNRLGPLNARLLTTALLVLGMGAWMGSSQAEQVTATGVASTSLATPTNLPPRVTGTYASNVTSMIPIWQGRGLSLSFKFNASAGTAANYVYIYPTVDGTNYSYLPLAMVTLVPNTTTDRTFTTNFSAATLHAYRGVGLNVWSNAAADTVTFTNKGVIVGRPNS